MPCPKTLTVSLAIPLPVSLPIALTVSLAIALCDSETHHVFPHLRIAIAKRLTDFEIPSTGFCLNLQ